MQTYFIRYFILLLLFVISPVFGTDTVLEIKQGTSIISLLQDNGVPSKEAYNAIDSLSQYYDPKTIRPGQEIIISTYDGETPFLQKLEFQYAFDEKITVIHNGCNYQAIFEKKEFKLKYRAAQGTITQSFYGDMKAAGVPNSIIMDLYNKYSFDVDFQRDLWEGDSFKILYEDFVDDNGNTVKTGPVIFSELKLSNTALQLFGFVTDQGIFDYYNEEGKSVRKALIKTPVANAVISSTFGKRKNPVYGYESFHKGLDFAAPKNTPIMAAGNGVIELASWFDMYGNCVIIRHNNGYKTLYGHMNGFGKGIRKGTRVTQGQIIGYVGTTGMSTGPHLHYEVIVDGKKINPATIKSPPEKNLDKTELPRFFQRRDQILQEFQRLQDSN